MNDRRVTPANDHVAASFLRGKIEAPRYTDGTLRRVAQQAATLWSAPGGVRARTLLFGDAFCLLDTQDGFGFGYALHDGYCGYVEVVALDDLPPPTHRVISRLAPMTDIPGFKNVGELGHLSLGSAVHQRVTEGRWAGITTRAGTRYVPMSHLAPIDVQDADPVAVAERLLGTPYVWAGNTSLGIDCSGLVQVACRLCGIACPGDSDQQEAALGAALPADAPLRRGDLMFWKGHVAWVADPDTLLHANAYHMAVAFEPLQAAIHRIAAQGDGAVTARKRIGAADRPA